MGKSDRHRTLQQLVVAALLMKASKIAAATLDKLLEDVVEEVRDVVFVDFKTDVMGVGVLWSQG